MLLIIDDDKALTQSLCEMLSANGHECESASSAEQALLKMKDTTYDLILLDMVMEGMGGEGFLDRYDAVAPGAKVIVLTAFPSLDTAVTALSGGVEAKAVGYLEKPVDSRRLLRIIETHMTKWEFDEFTLNLVTNIVTYQGEPISLTKRPFSLFHVFLTNVGKWLTYQEIGQLLDGLVLDSATAANRYKTLVSRLRSDLRETAGYEVIHSRGNNFGFALLRQATLENN